MESKVRISRNYAKGEFIKLKTILVDDDPRAIACMGFDLSEVQGIEVVGSFTGAYEALEYAGKNPVELALLDIQMPQMNGLELSRRLREKNPSMCVIFLTEHEQFAMEAIRNKAAAYVLKPYMLEDFLYAVETAQLVAKRPEKKIFARTFGNFDLFIDGKAMLFKSAKAKELLAFLVDRQGGTVYTGQIIAHLWENRPNDDATQNLCSKISRTLKNELEAMGIGEMLIQHRGIKSVDVNRFECDLYQMLDGDTRAAQKYLGEYMSEYEWAEERTAALQKYL